jgi:hypothetical protein
LGTTKHVGDTVNLDIVSVGETLCAEKGTYIRLKLVIVSHAATRNPIGRQLGRTACRLCYMMKSNHVFFRAVTKLLGRVADKEIAQDSIFAIGGLPLTHVADVNPVKLVSEGIAEKAQVARLQQVVGLVVPG